MKNYDNDELSFYHYIDPLTGLENRFAFLEYLKKNSHINIFLINIDNFSSINSSYGFAIGDKLLVEVSKLLKVIKPEKSELFRFNNDEFIYAVTDDLRDTELKDFCESTLSFFSQADLYFEDSDIELKISVSIGVSSGAGVSNLNQAVLALVEARRFHKNSYLVYDPKASYVIKELELSLWVNKIKDALEEERLNAFFQPIVNNHTQKIEKFECLARIAEDDKIISPYLFMQATKQSGSIVLLTKAIIKQSFKKFRDTDFEFSLNITGNDLQLEYLEDFLMIYVKKYNIDPSRVVLEILEDIVSLDEDIISIQLNSLKALGFQIAIDDFGAESSNFSRLLELSPDYLKIDGVFIKDLCTSEKSQIIVEAIVSVCKKSGIKVIAEYIHSKEVQDKVVEMGIDYSQGYFFSPPTQELVTSI